METSIGNLMTLAQEFACAWAYFGGPLDDGDGQEQAAEAKEALRAALTTALAAQTPTGLPIEQEPKYTVSGTAVINRASGEEIPADEPVFIFRARDLKALHALRAYSGHLTDAHHRAAVTARIADFLAFAEAHPERTKEPDTAPIP